MSLQWNEDYAIGIPQIDDQHREIFRRIGAFHAALRGEEAGDALERTFAFLEEYTRTHFRDEEAVMEAHRYALLPQHRAEHQELIDRLAAWKAESGSLRRNLQVAGVLGEWLRSHIAGSDRALAYVIGGRKKAA